RPSVPSVRSEVGQPKLCAVILANISAKLFVVRMRFDLEFQSARYADHFTGTGLQITNLGEKSDPSLFRNDQHLAVGIVKISIPHAFVKGIDMDRNASLRKTVSIAGYRHDTVDEIRRLRRDRDRIPTQLIRGGRYLVKRRRAEQI